MEPFVRRFIRSSLIWLAVGLSIGLAMAIAPARALAFRPAHMHANLLGFVSMMIFGVAYHVLPRFSGQPLYHRGMAAAHVWFANAGLALMVGGWMLRGYAAGPGYWLLVSGGVLSASGALLFIVNIWRTLDGAGGPHRLMR